MPFLRWNTHCLNCHARRRTFTMFSLGKHEIIPSIVAAPVRLWITASERSASSFLLLSSVSFSQQQNLKGPWIWRRVWFFFAHKNGQSKKQKWMSAVANALILAMAVFAGISLHNKKLAFLKKPIPVLIWEVLAKVNWNLIFKVFVITLSNNKSWTTAWQITAT